MPLQTRVVSLNPTSSGFREAPTRHVHADVHAEDSSGVSVATVRDLLSRRVSVPSPGHLAQILGSNRVRV